MTTVSDTFLARWRDAENQVGAAAPFQKIEIRKGRFYRGFKDWTYPEGGPPAGMADYVYIPTSPSNQGGKPWQATWTPQSAFVPIQGLSSVTLQKDFTANNGIGNAVITVENTRLQQFVGPGGAYHTWDRGYLTPWRGGPMPARSSTVPFENEWFGVLARDSEIRIWQGYGADTMVPTFTGLIDEVELTSGSNGSDQVVITARSFGRVLADQTFFAWNMDPTLVDPLTFADRGWCNTANANPGKYWVQVDDLANIVRTILRWAGFKHWQVADTGQGLNPGQPFVFNRANYYIDAIADLCRMTGFIFFVGDPDPNDPHSIGIPVFRYPRALVDLANVEIVHDKHLLTDVQATVSDADRAYIIRVRGKIAGITDPEGHVITVSPETPIDALMRAAEQITTLGGDFSLRPMYTYRPPWTQNDEEAGILKHVTHTDDYLVTLGDCRTACFLIAAQEALSAYTAVASCPGNPAIGLDEHISIWDHGTGLSTRVWVSNVKSVFTWGVDQEQATEPLWVTTFGGSMIDAPDLLEIKKELKTANLDFLPYLRNPAMSAGYIQIPAPVQTTVPPPDATVPPPQAGQPNAPVTVGSLLFDGLANIGTSGPLNGLDPTLWLVYFGSMNAVSSGPGAQNLAVVQDPLGSNALVAKLILSDANTGITITTKGKFQFGIGTYLEYVAFFSTIQDWDAVWTTSAGWPATGEYDLAETLGGRMTQNYHTGGPSHGGTDQASNGPALSGNWTAGYHSFGVHRKADGLTADFYVDSVYQRTVNTYDSGAQHWLMVTKGGANAPVRPGPLYLKSARVWTA